MVCITSLKKLLLEGVERSDLIHEATNHLEKNQTDPGDLFFAKVTEETGSTLTVQDGNGPFTNSTGLNRISSVLKKA